MTKPAPGSYAAMKLGCKCNMLINQMGLGVGNYSVVRVYMVDVLCTLHKEGDVYLPPMVHLSATERRIARQKGEVRVAGIVEKVQIATARRKYFIDY